MLIYAFSLLLGVVLFTTKAQLIPDVTEWVQLALVALTGVLLWVKKYNKAALSVVFLLAGYVWMGVDSYRVLSARVPAAYLDKPLTITGMVTDLPNHQNGRVRFLLTVEQPFEARIRLSWYPSSKQQIEPVRAGDVWQFRVKLKANNGFQNPAGFDYEKWLFTNKIDATGYVINHAEHKKISHNDAALASWRDQTRQGLLSHLQGLDYGAMIIALAMGDRSLMTPDNWSVLTRTNTSHLTVVSGLHIGLIAGFIFLVVNWLWRRSAYLCLRLPAQKLAAYLAMAAALCYALMAGFSVPTQRAFIMVTIALSHFMFNRYHSVWTLYAYALIAVLLINPLSVLSVGFWLSFAAVFVILYGLHLSVNRPWYQRIMLLQLGLFVGLMPLLALFFQSLSLLAPFANIIAVPFVSFLVLPLVLLGVLGYFVGIGIIADGCFAVADWLLGYLISLLHWLSGIEWGVVNVAEPTSMIAFILAVIGVLVLMLPAGLKLRRFGWVLLLPLLLPQQSVIDKTSLRLSVLDAGQSLAVIIRTKHHTMVYDSGFATSSGFNIGEAVIMPVLNKRGINRLDKVMISHSDADHIGGLAALRQAIGIDEILTSDITKITDSNRCYQGLNWHWDGVYFEVLSPESNSQLVGNNASCVLKISTPKHSILLTADIEKPAEKSLLRHQKQQLKADVMLMPHHGSLTSSSVAFIEAVSPDWALISSGYRNRFGLPKQAVIERYVNRGIDVVDTQCAGAIEVVMGDDISMAHYRLSHSRYWMRQCY